MNTAIAATSISMLGAGLFGGLHGMLFHHTRGLSAGFPGLEQKLDDNTAAVKNLETKLTNKLTNKLTAQIRGHGKRLARIEAKLDIDPTAEAA
ncbi:MAG: hypothetical protein OXF04_07830 [bacterium]|nr:hypothetical protein [bacterium]